MNMSLLERFNFITKKTSPEVPELFANSAASSSPFGVQTPTIELIGLDELADVVTFVEGDVILDDATLSHDAYFVLDGRLDIVRQGQIVADVQPGWFAGEISIHAGRRRNATVVAGTDCRAYHLKRGNFETLYATCPAIKAHIEETIKVRQPTA